VKRRKRPPIAQELRPEFWLNNTDEVLAHQRALSRKAGAEKRHQYARLTDKARTAIDEYRGRHPNANNTDIAKQLQKNSATMVPRLKHGKPMLKDEKPVPLTVPALARKIGREHPRK
jgi:hypothetical protein